VVDTKRERIAFLSGGRKWPRGMLRGGMAYNSKRKSSRATPMREKGGLK
jgi:hypothetical protein